MIEALHRAAAASFVSPEAMAFGVVLIAVAFVLLAKRRERLVEAGAPSAASAAQPTRFASFLIWILLFGLAGAFLLCRIGESPGPDTLFVWESAVVDRQVASAREGTTTLQLVRQCLRWDDGLVARGDAMMLFGPPSYALLNWLDFDPVALRLVSVWWALASLPLIYLLGKRFGGGSRLGGFAAAICLALDQTFLFLGHYGTGLSATVFSLLLAIHTAWWFLERERPPFWSGLACAASFFLATLHYSPARLAVLLLLAGLVWCLVRHWRIFGWRHRIGVAVIFLCAGGVAYGEWKAGTARLFLAARGEQAAYFVDDPYYVEAYLKQPKKKALSLLEKAQLLGAVAAENWPNLRWHFTPSWQLSRPPGVAALQTDPPRIALLRAGLFPFLLLGFGVAWATGRSRAPQDSVSESSPRLARLRGLQHTFLLLWVLGTAAALLLTTRVDSYRLNLLAIPFSLWAAAGIVYIHERLRHARWTRVVAPVLAVAVSALLVWQNVWMEFLGKVPPPGAAGLVAACVAKLPAREPADVVFTGDVGGTGWLRLNLERSWRHGIGPKIDHLGGVPNRFLDTWTLSQPWDRMTNEQLDIADAFDASLADRKTLFGPSELVRPVIDFLTARGYQLEKLKPPPSVAGLMKKEWALYLMPKQPQPISLEVAGTKSADVGSERTESVRLQWLAQMEPTQVTFGEAAPRMDKAIMGEPIRMAGQIYHHGIGMHTPCQMTYRIPADATVFEATIGFSDGVSNPTTLADAAFRIRDETGRIIYSSGRLTPADGVRAVRVGVRGVKEITLSVSESRNGRNSDHVNWASAAFVIDLPEVAPPPSPPVLKPE